MVELRIPASSANMGAGFDTLGIALNLYNRIWVGETESGLSIRNDGSDAYIPRDERNLIYRAMRVVFDYVGYTVRGLKIVQKSEIPMTRGLGSSSACIVGGMLAANVISGRKLSYSDIISLAAKTEGHPDNVGPAMYGGFCVSVTENGRTVVKSSKLSPKIKFAAMIPGYFVATRKSRGVLPEKVDFADAVYNVSHALLFHSALTNYDMDALRQGVRDKLHQPYRKEYMNGMDKIFERTYELGSCATYLSGSGPTIVSVLDGEYEGFKSGMDMFFSNYPDEWSCRILEVDNVGAVVRELINPTGTPWNN